MQSVLVMTLYQVVLHVLGSGNSYTRWFHATGWHGPVKPGFSLRKRWQERDKACTREVAVGGCVGNSEKSCELFFYNAIRSFFTLFKPTQGGVGWKSPKTIFYHIIRGGEGQVPDHRHVPHPLTPL